MTVISRNPFWSFQSGLVRPFPTLGKDETTDVLIVGGGISGALIAHELVAQGLQTMLIEQANIGGGSTSGSTALIQYEADVSLSELAKSFNEKSAEQIYLSTFAATQKIRELAERLIPASFREKQSFYLGSKKSDVEFLKKEAQLRQKIGLPVDFVERNEIEKLFKFSRPAALRSKKVFELDPYLFTHSLIEESKSQGLKAYDRTQLENFTCEKNQIVVLLKNGFKIRTKKLIFAVGYQVSPYLPKSLFKLHSTFALISKPVPHFEGWHEQAQIWETKRPYVYLRTTPDGRALIGGLDEKFSKSWLRDQLIPRKSAELEQTFKEFFPKIQFQPDYSWAGTFGETKDSLPYIGNFKKYPNVFFCCGFGGNGVTFSALAADFLAKELKGNPAPQASLFSFSR